MSSSAMDPRVRHVAVGISAEALIQQWARQQAAPAGATVVVDTEIAARRRGGLEWRHDDAVAVAVLARPTLLDPEHVDVAWAAAGLATIRMLDELRGGTHRCRWPDGVEVELADGELDAATAAVSALGPGRVEHVALVARLAPIATIGSREAVVGLLAEHLRQAAASLEEAVSVLDEYRTKCTVLGHDVDVRLLPHGSTRGRAVDIDETGALVVESATGLLQRVHVGALRSVDVISEPDS